MVTKVKIINRDLSALTFVLEPWADTYTVGPGEDVEILISSDTAPRIDWEISPGGNLFVVHDPAGASVEVRQHGKKIS